MLAGTQQFNALPSEPDYSLVKKCLSLKIVLLSFTLKSSEGDILPSCVLHAISKLENSPFGKKSDR